MDFGLLASDLGIFVNLGFGDLGFFSMLASDLGSFLIWDFQIWGFLAVHADVFL